MEFVALTGVISRSTKTEPEKTLPMRIRETLILTALLRSSANWDLNQAILFKTIPASTLNNIVKTTEYA